MATNNSTLRLDYIPKSQNLILLLSILKNVTYYLILENRWLHTKYLVENFLLETFWKCLIIYHYQSTSTIDSLSTKTLYINLELDIWMRDLKNSLESSYALSSKRC